MMRVCLISLCTKFKNKMNKNTRSRVQTVLTYTRSKVLGLFCLFLALSITRPILLLHCIHSQAIQLSWTELTSVLCIFLTQLSCAHILKWFEYCKIKCVKLFCKQGSWLLRYITCYYAYFWRYLWRQSKLEIFRPEWFGRQ